MPPDPRTLVVYFSRTGTTQSLAQRVVGHLDDPTVERIRPQRERSYPNWLARSAVPNSRVAIEEPEHAPREFDAVFLGTPKWTLSCPPVTEYLHRADLTGARVGVFLTFGGFDQARYLRSLVARLRDAGANVPASLPVKRDRVEEADTDGDIDRTIDSDVARFSRRVTRTA